MKKTLISGVKGQDGSYSCELFKTRVCSVCASTNSEVKFIVINVK